MATHPSVVRFGPSGRSASWWAAVPSGTALHADGVSDLLAEVERAMARSEPDRPFALILDLYGEAEPGVPAGSPLHGSAAHRLEAQRRLPLPTAPTGWR